MANTILKLFFPTEIRSFPYQRLILDLLRAVHILCVCILLGGLYFSPDATQLQHWLTGVILTGCGLLGMELYRTAAILLELRGLSVLLKLAVLYYLPGLTPTTQLITLMLLVIMSTLSSHSPRRIRHLSFLPHSWQTRLNTGHHPTKKDPA